jgi:hypothetical protein
MVIVHLSDPTTRLTMASTLCCANARLVASMKALGTMGRFTSIGRTLIKLEEGLNCKVNLQVLKRVQDGIIKVELGTAACKKSGTVWQGK